MRNKRPLPRVLAEPFPRSKVGFPLLLCRDEGMSALVFGAPASALLANRILKTAARTLARGIPSAPRTRRQNVELLAATAWTP